MAGVNTQGGRALRDSKRNQPKHTQYHIPRITFPNPREIQGRFPARDIVKPKIEPITTNGELPIMAYKARIQRAVLNNNVTVIQAETGSGKSTEVPMFLADLGYRVVVTQPRRMAAVNLATYVSAKNSTELGEEVGFQHGFGKCCNALSKVTYLTDGLLLAQKLGGHRGSDQGTVYVIDEAHEKNMYMETLLAMFLQELQNPKGPKPKLVIMSATLNTDKVRKVFGLATPVIKVPGRTFRVDEREKGKSILADAVDAVRRGENTLIFLPGKHEISQMETAINAALAKEGMSAAVMPLHSKLSSAEQQRTMAKYDVPKIVLATNVAEASITIPDIDLVIMSGLVKRIVVENGVPCLRLMAISKFNFTQEKGRAGRTHPGKFIYHGETPHRYLDPEPPADIQNSRLESLFLRLISSPVLPNREAIERLPFPSRITKKRMDETFRVLQNLNLCGPKGHITTEGKAVANLPVDVRIGKMLITAQQKSVAYEDFEILRLAIDVAVVQENGGVVNSSSKDWKILCDDEKDSDAIAQALVFQSAIGMSPESQAKCGIDSVSMRRCTELKEVLLRRFKLDLEKYPIRHMDETIHQAVLESIWSGCDALFSSKKTDKGTVYLAAGSQDNLQRILDRSSILPRGTRLVSGMPFDVVSYKDPEKPKLIPLIHFGVRVSAKWYQTNGPQMVRQKLGGLLRGEANHKPSKPSPKDRTYRNEPRGKSHHQEF